MDELVNRISSSNTAPDIIAITEVKPKNSRYPVTPGEITSVLPNYNIYHQNLDIQEGRGLIILTNKGLEVIEIEMKTKFKENLTIQIKLRGSDKLTICCCYRSPNSTRENNETLLDLFDNLDSANQSHLLILGDFNYGGISWETSIEESSGTTQEQALKNKIEDLFWTQVVTKPTRQRGNDTPSLLDLAITNDINMIANLTHESPLGSSDHEVLILDFLCYLLPDRPTISRPNLTRANIEGIRDCLRLNWESLLQDKDADTQWKIISSHINSAQENLIPKIQKSYKKRITPYNNSIRKEINKKHRAWTRYIETKDPNKLIEYKRQRNKVRKITRAERREMELKLSQSVKTNPKTFWNYVNRVSKVKSIIPDLEETGDEISSKIFYTNDKDKANHLNQFFQSVQTVEDASALPNYTMVSNNRLPELQITKEEVQKKLKKLNSNKSAGPDGIFPKILKESA